MNAPQATSRRASTLVTPIESWGVYPLGLLATKWPLAIVLVALSGATASADDAIKLPTVPPESVAADDVQDLLILKPPAVMLVRLHLRRDGAGYQAAWGDYLVGLFEQLDRDGSLTLDVDEFAKGPWHQFTLRRGALASRTEQLDFLALDAAPYDESISLDEFVTGLAACGVRVQTSQGGMRSAVTLRLVPPAAAVPLIVDPNESRRDIFYDLLDDNADGRIARTEVEHCTAFVDRWDIDGDEILSLDEISLAVATRSATRNADPSRPASTSALVTLSPLSGADPAATVDDVIRAYDQPERRGERGNGVLEPREFALDEVQWSAIDGDGDKRLVRGELADWLAALKPAVELVAHIDAKVDDKEATESESSPVLALVASGSDFTAGVTAEPTSQGGLRVRQARGAEITLAIAAPPKQADAENNLRPIFKQVDRDQNGYLDTNESNFIGRLFARADGDGNGMIFLEEFLAWNRDETQTAARRIDVDLAPQAADLFTELASSARGRLGRRSLQSLSQWLDQVDQNGDGLVEPAERLPRLAISIQSGRAAIAGGTSGVFVPNDFRTRSIIASPSESPGWFGRMDANRDGDVSRREFIGPLADFRRMDADGDGLLSATEAKSVAAASP